VYKFWRLSGEIRQVSKVHMKLTLGSIHMSVSVKWPASHNVHNRFIVDAEVDADLDSKMVRRAGCDKAWIFPRCLEPMKRLSTLQQTSRCEQPTMGMKICGIEWGGCCANA